jgi:signal transduction histidine kinase
MIDKILALKLFALMIFVLFTLQNYEVVFTNHEVIFSHYTPLKTFIAILCFGIILSASIYNMALYIYSKDKRYLYYSLGQFSVIIFLYALDALHIAPLNALFTYKSFLLYDISQIFILLFSILFIKYFLSITKEQKKLSIMIDTIQILAIFDILLSLIMGHSVLTRIIPIFFPIWLVITEAKRLLPHKDKAFYFFYYGWSMVILMGLFVYSNLTTYFNMDFPFLHTTFALESMILSLAIAYKMKVLEDERVIQQSLLLQQSRLASMGEMVSTIAHQWRQPLTHLSYLFMNMRKKLDNPTFLKEKLEEGKAQINYMSQTIEHFSNFYNPSKERHDFSIHAASKEAILIASSSLNSAEIELSLDIKEDFQHHGNQNELEQVILNLINNARDILIERKVPHPYISIMIEPRTIMIKDNAGGVEEKNLQKIFEPYFTTKIKSDGIGLYIAKTIIEKEMGGKLTVKNGKEGAIFTITL